MVEQLKSVCVDVCERKKEWGDDAQFPLPSLFCVEHPSLIFFRKQKQIGKETDWCRNRQGEQTDQSYREKKMNRQTDR